MSRRGCLFLWGNCEKQVYGRAKKWYDFLKNGLVFSQVPERGGVMKDILTRIKASMIFSAILCVLLGLVLLICPKETIDLLCKALAVGVMIMGVVNLVSYFMNREVQTFSGILGLIILLVGIWIFLKPERVEGIIPIVIGAILVVHALQDIKLSIETKRGGYDKWYIMLLIAVVSLVFGIICIVNAVGVVTLALQVIGVALIYDGVSDLWVVSRALRTEKEVRRAAEAVDVEYEEVDSDEER